MSFPEIERLSKSYPTYKEKEKWLFFGPYLSERAWGTVREDYSATGEAWDFLPHDAARSKAYRWNEDGLGGISDDKQNICFAVALWNEKDPILKERTFGLTGPQGNHGEDVKEYYFYLDSTPTHSYMKYLYKYTQREYPYSRLIEENAKRSRYEFEYELLDTGIFWEERYFDVFVEYAKADPKDLLIKITVKNRGNMPAPIHILPTLWFRNNWSWGYNATEPLIYQLEGGRHGSPAMEATHPVIGDFVLYCEGAQELLFTNNDTNHRRLYGTPNPKPYVKDGINDYIVYGTQNTVNPEKHGTKASAHYHQIIEAGGEITIRLRLCEEKGEGLTFMPFADFEAIFALRQKEADEFYENLYTNVKDEDERRVYRQAMAGMLWTKQFYHYVIDQWLDGDPAQPKPPDNRKEGRNSGWRNIYNERVMSMPDKWEYPWYAAWDLAFHCIPYAYMDCEFAKEQLDLLTREWYQHPNGQIPAYEWAFGDVNPPVFAWAAWRVYKIEQKHHRRSDRAFLERIFHKLLINFTWWVNRKDSENNNVFQGGFLGLDNIGVFDRSAPLPTGGTIEQSDGTSWMGMFCLNMMTIALELARNNSVYEDIATKFFEHFLAIAYAMNHVSKDGIALWDEEDEFFYDVLHLPNGTNMQMKVRSLVGLIPLLAVEVIDDSILDVFPGFASRLRWYLDHRPDLSGLISRWYEPGMGQRRLLALTRGRRMKRLLKRMLDPNEFLSDFGVRSLSRYHKDHPYELWADGSRYAVEYQPAESNTGLFGGNSNWRGPIWFPINYLLIESLQRFHYYYGDDFKVECPTGSGNYLTLDQIGDELSRRLIKIFVRNGEGKRHFNGGIDYFNHDPHWRDYVLFHEYFHGDNGAGLGASHQTGWTGLVAKLISQQGNKHNGRRD
jgi:hypothetical protein